jgi:hypothetical protein
MQIRPSRWVFAAVLMSVVLLWFAVSWRSTAAHVESHREPPSRTPMTPTSIAHEAPRPTETPKAPTASTPQTSAPASATASPGATIPPPQRTGPVEELARAFATEPRASDASGIESRVAVPFQRADVPAGLLQSVLCRTTVCRVEASWSPERAQGFLAALMQLAAQPNGQPTEFDPQLAIAPAERASQGGSLAVTVYLRRATGPTAEPQLPVRGGPAGVLRGEPAARTR